MLQLAKRGHSKGNVKVDFAIFHCGVKVKGSSEAEITKNVQNIINVELRFLTW